MTKNYKTYQQTLKKTFSKIPLIFQENNYLPTEDIYIELALSDYSHDYQRKMDSISKENFDNLPIVLQEKKLAKEIRKLPMETLLNGGEEPKGYMVLGDPGSGKSTLLKTIAYRSASGQAKYPKYLFHIELKKFIDEMARFENLEQINVITEYISRYQLHQKYDIFTLELFDERPYFLVDGWDEIAGSKIVSVVQDAIDKTLQIGHVIVTSRRAGRLGGFGGFTFFEIVELSSRSIRNYILNFAKAQHIDAIATREKLLGSILGSESLLKMAQNPFLLSLICYLKSKELFNDTAFQIRNRVELYAMAMEEIRREFNHKFGSRNFTQKKQKVLEGFAFWLFNPKGKTKHIFSTDDFENYSSSSTLLNEFFLPSKVLDVFHDTREIFFIHLTFQEFLVAMQLAHLEYSDNCRVIREVFDKPSWREVLRFYAGILHSDFKPAGANKKFTYLLEFAWSHKDRLGLVESEIAHWFIEAGVQKPHAPFDGLKTSLWERFAQGKKCAEYIFEPILKAWRDEEDIEKTLKELQEPKLNLKLLQYIPFVATSSNIFHQKKILDIMLDNATNLVYKKTIASSLGQSNRVELIESYCQHINQMEDEQIVQLLQLISYTQDSEYYPFIEPLLMYGNNQVKDEAYETVIKIQAEPFLENIEIFFQRYIENSYEEKFSILYYWEDETIVRLLNGYALDRSVSIKMRVKIMEVMYENMYRESIATLDRNDYLMLLQTATNAELKRSAIMMYSALLSVTPTERLRKEFELVKEAESFILSIATNQEENFELRLTALQALKANRLRGITLFQIYMPLSELIFDENEELELRNGALEVMCEQAYYFKELGIVEEIFDRGLKLFSGDMLINILFFIGQYGYKQYTKELRALAKSADSPYIQGIAIQSLGDLKDRESLEFIYHTFLNTTERYIREISVESILKLEPKYLLSYSEDEFVYSQLCRFVVDSGEVLREAKIVIEEETDMSSSRDVFISHASEDKLNIVEPLVEKLEANSISCWYDKKDIGWGDSIVGKINEGLETSKYVVFIISRTFLAKEWTKIELNNTLNIQISSGQKKVLPIVVGDLQHNELPPLLRDKKYIQWSHQEDIVDELKKILGMVDNSQVDTNNVLSIPMPKRRKKITQLDKDRFTEELYKGVVNYFDKGLKQLKEHDNRVDINLKKVTEVKFVATVYLDGEIESQCKIWMGGVFGSSGISYSIGNGYMDISDDNSFNDWLSIQEDENGIFMQGSGMSVWRNQDIKITNGGEAGAYFWESFIQPLER